MKFPKPRPLVAEQLIHVFGRIAFSRDSKRSVLIAISLYFMFISGGCVGGYQFGQQALFAPDIRTVYVPMIESDSFRRNLGEKLTEAVCKKIETDTPFKIVNDPNAQSVLNCKIVNDTKRLVVKNLLGDVRNTEINFQILVSWKDQRGEVIREQSINVPPSAVAALNSVDVGNAAQLIPEYGQSVASAQQEVVNNLAGQIVGLMEVPW